MKPDEVVIIGAGPAGMTAAIQLKRYGIPFVLLEKERVGGLLWNANLVENYPGFPVGVGGPKLVRLIEKQMERIGVEVTFDSVLRLSRDAAGFYVKTIQAEYNPRYVLVASGTSPNPFPLVIPDRAQGKVFSDVYHLLSESNKRIVIIGAGDAAFDYALNLVKKGNFVTILNRGGDVKCLRLLWERAMAESAIEYRAETPVSKVDFDKTADRLRVQLGAGESLEADYLLFAIGRIPQTDFLSDELADKMVKGYLFNKSGCGVLWTGAVRPQHPTSPFFLRRYVKGLYFVGDVKNGLFRQAAIAAGDGLRAAMEIYTTLNTEV